MVCLAEMSDMSDMSEAIYTFLKYEFELVATQGTTAIFGFAEFMSAMSLFVILYSTTDEKFRFRAAVAPLPLISLTYAVFCFLGSTTLVSDLWFHEGWKVPRICSDYIMLQTFLGMMYFLLILTWVFFAFIRPPCFSQYNAERFYHEFYRLILRGTESELLAIAKELARSMHNIANYAGRKNSTPKADRATDQKPTIGDYARQLLLLIGTRKFCRYVAVETPVTAIALFEAMKERKLYRLPAAQFASNTFAEALLNENSILYHEDSGWQSGLLGYFKSFKNSLFGNHNLIEGLSSDNNGPLDVGFGTVTKWSAKQLSVYGECLLIFFKAYFDDYKTDGQFPNSFAFNRALDILAHASSDTYKLEALPDDYYQSDIYERLSNSVDILRNMLRILGEEKSAPSLLLREKRASDPNKITIYDGLLNQIVNCMIEIILHASGVRKDRDKCWGVHYNAVWGDLAYSNGESKYIAAVMHRFRRRIYDEVAGDDKRFNFKSARLLGFCLNVMGLKLYAKNAGTLDKDYRSLHKALLKWTQENFLKIYKENPELAEACLMGGITFDAPNKRLIKTFIKGLNKEEPKDFLPLQEPGAAE